MRVFRLRQSSAVAQRCEVSRAERRAVPAVPASSLPKDRAVLLRNRRALRCSTAGSGPQCRSGAPAAAALPLPLARSPSARSSRSAVLRARRGARARTRRGATAAPSAAPRGRAAPAAPRGLLRPRSPPGAPSPRGASRRARPRCHDSHRAPGPARLPPGRRAASRSAPPALPPAGSAGDSARLPPQEAPQPPRRLPLGALRWQVRLPASSRSRRRRRGRGSPGAEGPGGGRGRARPGDGGGRGGGTAGPRGAAASPSCCRVAFSSAGSPRPRVPRPPPRWISAGSRRPEVVPGASAGSIPVPCGSAPDRCPRPGAYGDAALTARGRVAELVCAINLSADARGDTSCERLLVRAPTLPVHSACDWKGRLTDVFKPVAATDLLVKATERFAAGTRSCQRVLGQGLETERDGGMQQHGGTQPEAQGNRWLLALCLPPAGQCLFSVKPQQNAAACRKGRAGPAYRDAVGNLEIHLILSDFWANNVSRRPRRPMADWLVSELMQSAGAGG